MSVAATLSTAYTVLARRADEEDRATRMFGKADDATARDDLDKALGVVENPVLDEGDGMTNVVELRAFIRHVNETMR